MNATLPEPVECLTNLLREVSRLECRAVKLENRILKKRLAIEVWYAEHRISTRADFEPKPLRNCNLAALTTAQP